MRTGIHVGVDVFINMLGVERRRKVILFGLLCGALFTAIVGSLGAYLVWHIGEIGQVSQDLEVPMWIVYLCVPLGSYLMCFRFLQVAWAYARSGELPSHDHAEVKGLEEESKPAAVADMTVSSAIQASEPQSAARPHHFAASDRRAGAAGGACALPASTALSISDRQRAAR